jgi:hypothetical protein
MRDVTNDVMLALCADLISGEEDAAVSREVRFADGTVARVLVEMCRRPACDY